tara:strand:- start:451 stop:717 length:267 start_codon:yes stop_codon:yes gene_type:complete
MVPKSLAPVPSALSRADVDVAASMSPPDARDIARDRRREVVRRATHGGAMDGDGTALMTPVVPVPRALSECGHSSSQTKSFTEVSDLK